MSIRASIKPLAWESDFFGLTSGLLVWDPQAPVLEAEQCAGWPRLQAKVDAVHSERLDALQRLGFQLVEGEADFVLAVGDAAGPQQARSATLHDISILRCQAASLFSASRFRSPWYPPDASGRFYAQWVENAVRGTFDHQCLIMGPSSQPQGFVSLRQLAADEARIGLLAGRGQGAALVNAARVWCAERGIRKLFVATQLSNRAAMQRYISSGGTLCSTAYWLYR